LFYFCGPAIFVTWLAWLHVIERAFHVLAAYSPDVALQLAALEVVPRQGSTLVDVSMT